MNFKKLLVLLMVTALPVKSIRAQGCPIGASGVTLDIEPKAPVDFQSFPISLLGIGNSSSNLSSFENFGFRFANSSSASVVVYVGVSGNNNGDPIFSNAVVAVTLPAGPGTTWIAFPQLVSGKYSGGAKVQSQSPVTLTDAFSKKIKGGFPNGRFEFQVSAGPSKTDLTSCGSIIANVGGNISVDLILPQNGSDSPDGLPLIQWSGLGGTDFILTIARIKNNRSKEDALNTSSGRAVIELTGKDSYQVTAFGPSQSSENHLEWNPGLTPGEYACRVVMVVKDPLNGTEIRIPSGINTFKVGGGSNQSGIDTEQLIQLLNDALKANIGDQLKGFKAESIMIDGSSFTMDGLREKLKSLPENTKYEIK